MSFPWVWGRKHIHKGECIGTQYIDHPQQKEWLHGGPMPAHTVTLALLRCTCGLRWVANLPGRWTKSQLNGITETEAVEAFLNDAPTEE